ncbi:hypothetical protein DFA_11885 [Cavenderia fasciculata]|uniref:Rab GTPase n=1 Tax=Cavenderia fasciculata TaxID=261658 RepID=F4QEL0_CACFS|nr:uncharacterized protein DFA_11885 [Cavenderia fasciculata]EGG14121.1 hypothetical protein DFA_11885 [Cavenderia fasciculata]|eukprot:XP_004350829.1 hypothetical protein DFA_11885 [Cavenderia fasciculata]
MSCFGGWLNKEQEQTRILKEKNYFGSTLFKGRTNFKLILVGDLDSGKTTIERRLAGEAVSETYEPRCSEFSNLILPINDYQIKVCLWDTMGQERFVNRLPTPYYRGSDFIFMVYDITSLTSFTNLSLNWLSAVTQQQKQQANVNCVTPNILIIGNKLDLSDKRVVSFEQGQTFAQENGCEYLEISAFKGDNFQSLKDHIINYIQQKIKIESDNLNK